VDFQRSEYEQGQPFYVVMKGVDLTTGERVVLTTGSRKVTAQAFQLARRGWLPAKVVAKQATRPTRDGYFPLRLESGPRQWARLPGCDWPDKSLAVRPARGAARRSVSPCMTPDARQMAWPHEQRQGRWVELSRPPRT
jgi:hypothetical protein